MSDASVVTAPPAHLIESARRLPARHLAVLAAIVALAGICAFRWGAYLLIADDALPAHVEVAVVLQGSVIGQKARLAGAMQLLQEGKVSRVLLSIPHESYWDEAVQPLARHYLEQTYGNDVAGRVDFCETGPDVNSTEDEAKALSKCILAHGWPTVAVVTSSYHTRRAGIIWSKVMEKRDPSAHLWVHAVSDPEFQPQGWWRERIYAKTTFMEFIKLVWVVFT